VSNVNSESDLRPLAPTDLRRAEVNYAICAFLRDAGGPVHVQTILTHVIEVYPPTAEERETINAGRMRYDIFIRWASSGLSRAGWITKSGVAGMWEITAAGREASAAFPTPVDLYRRMRQHNAANKSMRTDGLGKWGLVDGIVGRIPVGRWVSFSDLTAVTGMVAGVAGVHMWSTKPTGWHRVLRQGGVLSAEAIGDEHRSQEQRELLEREGITVDPTAPDGLRLSSEDLESLAASISAPPRAWLIRGTSVRGASIIPEWLDEGFVSLPASQLGILPVDAQDTDIKTAVFEGYEGLGYSQREIKYDEIRIFMTRILPGHLVLTVAGPDVYVGEVSGESEQVESQGRRSNLRRSVEWINPQSPLGVSDLTARLEGKLRTSADLMDLTEFYADVSALLPPGEDDEDALPEQDQVPVQSVSFTHLDDATVDRLLIGRVWLDEFVDLLTERRQVILYGPPGTGKTFLAQEVAETLGGTERVTLVQFHPSYSYEDFFEGYRPTGSSAGGVSLQLMPGPFRKIVDLARENPGQPYFLIIDEINRANLAKVFGELYFLLEYRDRSIALLYASGDSGSAFTLPANVYVIGTMNTADRSIALVDTAMRRRFGFLSLHPDDERLDEVLRRWLAIHELPLDRADLLVALNKRIGEKDFKIGPSYLMTPVAGTEPGLARIWRTSILPLLEEYHVGESVDVTSRYGLAALRRDLASTVEVDLPTGE